MPCRRSCALWQHGIRRRLGPVFGDPGYDMVLQRPISAICTLSDEMLRAMRLVVDTGIPPRVGPAAVDRLMLSHSDMGKNRRHRRGRALHRDPKPALAYKIGALTIQRLRKKAKPSSAQSSIFANFTPRC